MLGRLLLLVIGLVVIAAVFLVVRFVVDKITRRDTSDRPPPWRDQNVLSLAAQVVALGLIVTVGAWLWSNFRDRTDAIGLELTFGFLDQPSGISIADNPVSSNAGIRDAIQQGVKNTFLIILLGIPLSVLFGTLIGVARLSSNWLLQKLATAYVEFFRNIPPLLVIVFLWGAVFLNFPAGSGRTAEAAWRPFGGWFIFSNNRFAFPSIIGLDNFGLYRLLILASVVTAVGVWVWRTRVFNNTGAPPRRVMWSLTTLVVLGLAFFFALGGPFEFSKTTVEDRIWSGGFRMQMPYAAVMLALVIYTASHIAEIVRGSILAVHKGQVEASHALALNGLQRYRFVILPQAFRIAFPPLINHFLNYTKNSSLAVAIGFQETTSIINNLFGNSQPAPQLLLILMLIYLTFSLILSAIGNLINGRLQMKGA
ncbi:MAG: ABC transporter permease subunit [Acidimicrobiaceae bacterium]|nr:ABC transporter permease subunit [Acidimicrobiaceae bacterium]MYD05981.1 ABC transporter permease subunit [Acidimicrobiaceae bacterium]MYI58041.1 ABC transporter permease subunit [Acidimicrobiaceae bacterium]